jgi:hypothetical protein
MDSVTFDDSPVVVEPRRVVCLFVATSMIVPVRISAGERTTVGEPRDEIERLRRPVARRALLGDSFPSGSLARHRLVA